MLRKFTSVCKWYGTIVPFVLMRDQRSQIDLFTPACSSASLLLRERRGVEKIKKDNLLQGLQVPYGRALMSA